MSKKLYISLIFFSNLVAIKILSSIHRMYNLYTKFVKILERCKQFSENLVNESGGQVRNVYLQKRKAQGLMTIEQVAEWAPQYSLEIQRTIRYIGMKIIDENESVEKAHAILKVWGDALQTITSPKPSPPPTLKSWWFYRWNRFRQRTDKWGLLQWYLVILGIIACVLFSSLYQNRVMDLDRTNRIFYKKVIMDEKRKRNYQELDSLIHSDSFFKTYWGLNN